MITRELGDWENRRLVEQVLALRHLPLGAQPPLLDIQRDQDLFASLLHLQDEIDPFMWLKENHGDLIARVLLWTALNEVGALLRGVRRAVQAGQTTAVDRHQLWLGNLLDLPENEDPLQQLIGTHPTTAPPELLRTMFQSLRAVYQEGPATTVAAVIDEKMLLLLDELFRLPEMMDPLEWIQDKHSDQAASQTLRYLLGQVRPPISLWHGQAMKSRRLDMHIPSEGYAIALHQLALGPSAFALTFRGRIPERLLRAPVAVLSSARSIRWEGVERIVDDLGYHYFVAYRLAEGKKQWFGRYDLSLQLLSYPAIAPAATRLILSSNAASLVVHGLPPGEQPQRLRPLHHVPLGDLTWTVKFAS